MEIGHFKNIAISKAKENKKFLKNLKKKNARDVDNVTHQLHEEVFAKTDCLKCANCCKTTSPIILNGDIERMSKALKLKPGDFINKYLKIDEDEDYVFTTSPCPFLGDDNYCSIYDTRPKACREYPHTNRKKMVQILDITYKNTMICPAVLEIVEELKSHF